MAKKAAANSAKSTPKNRKPEGATTYSDAEIIAALEKAQGMVGPAARILGCDPKTIRNRIASAPDVAAAKDNARELLLDTAELSLLRAVQNGEAWAVCFTLKTVGKGRGYVERHEMTTPEGITIRVVRDKKPLPGEL